MLGTWLKDSLRAGTLGASILASSSGLAQRLLPDVPPVVHTLEGDSGDALVRAGEGEFERGSASDHGEDATAGGHDRRIVSRPRQLRACVKHENVVGRRGPIESSNRTA